ncbi:MAG: hypothetical protein ACRENG_22225, partial [bacterium]
LNTKEIIDLDKTIPYFQSKAVDLLGKTIWGKTIKKRNADKPQPNKEQPRMGANEKISGH